MPKYGQTDLLVALDSEYKDFLTPTEFRELCWSHELSASEAALMIGVSTATIVRWWYGHGIPNDQSRALILSFVSLFPKELERIRDRHEHLHH